MADREFLENLFHQHGYTDFKWINPADIVVAQWVRFKCTFGCGGYGHGGCCPPNVPTVEECARFFHEYTTAAVFHFAKRLDNPEDRKAFGRDTNNQLLKLERDIFLAGYRKAFLLFMDQCRVCLECAGSRSQCKSPKMARPSPEGLGMDVYATVRKYGFPIEVLRDYSETMNRYAFLMID